MSAIGQKSFSSIYCSGEIPSNGCSGVNGARKEMRWMQGGAEARSGLYSNVHEHRSEATSRQTLIYFQALTEKGGREWEYKT